MTKGWDLGKDSIKGMQKRQLSPPENVIRKYHIDELLLDSRHCFTYWRYALLGHILDFFFSGAWDNAVYKKGGYSFPCKGKYIHTTLRTSKCLWLYSLLKAELHHFFHVISFLS